MPYFKARNILVCFLCRYSQHLFCKYCTEVFLMTFPYSLDGLSHLNSQQLAEEWESPGSKPGSQLHVTVLRIHQPKSPAEETTLNHASRVMRCSSRKLTFGSGKVPMLILYLGKVPAGIQGATPGAQPRLASDRARSSPLGILPCKSTISTIIIPHTL